MSFLNSPMCNYSPVEVEDVSITRVAKEQIGSIWGQEYDGGMGIDIEALHSEFGDYDDFFGDDTLNFGEPPGIPKCQAHICSTPDSGELGGSPSMINDISDQVLFQSSFPTFDNFNHSSAPMEDLSRKKRKATKNSSASVPVTCTRPSFSHEFDNVVKDEAMMSFAPGFGAVETPKSEIPSVFFRNPYVPKSSKVNSASNSSNYVYSATPPYSPCSVLNPV